MNWRLPTKKINPYTARMMIDVSILIVNFNTANLVMNCIRSVLKQRHIQFEIIVVDNASTDSSVAQLKSLGSDILLIENQKNIGFGAANNIAFSSSKGKYLFLLNPDAVFLTQDDLLHACTYMRSHAQCGLAGTRVVNLNHQIQPTTFKHYPRQDQTSINFSHLPPGLAAVLGASMIVDREAYKKTHGFDEDFFLYAEETDFCLRVRQAGFSIGFCPDVTVMHVGGASEESQTPIMTVKRKKVAKLLFYIKHYPHADVINIVKHDLAHARFHSFRLGLLKWCGCLSVSQQAKYLRYQIGKDLALKFLASGRVSYP